MNDYLNLLSIDNLLNWAQNNKNPPIEKNDKN